MGTGRYRSRTPRMGHCRYKYKYERNPAIGPTNHCSLQSTWASLEGSRNAESSIDSEIEPSPHLRDTHIPNSGNLSCFESGSRSRLYIMP